MNVVVALLILCVSLAGCSVIEGWLPASARPKPPPTPEAPPRPSERPVPSERLAPAPPIDTPTPPSEKPPPVVSPRVADEDRLTHEIRDRLAEARRLVARINLAKLAQDQREIYGSVQDFLEKAETALSAKDLLRAKILADKASKLAQDLAGTTNK